MPKDKINWAEFDALVDEQVKAAALADPDALPMDLSKLEKVPREETLRRTRRSKTLTR